MKVKSPNIIKALTRFKAIVNNLECECDSYTGFTCSLHEDKIIADKALKEAGELEIAIDVEKVAKILLKEECGMRWFQISGEEQNYWLDLAKALAQADIFKKGE